MASGKILLISYTFPPIPYGGTYRALRLCRGFAEKNLECHVVTLNVYDDIPNDYNLLDRVPDSIHIHRTPIIDPWRSYQRIKQKYIDKPWFKIINKVVSFGLRFMTFPDHMLFWVPFAVLKSRRVIKERGIDTILVSSPPDSSQLVGWILKKTSKVQWIADFRDPIYGNVAQVNLINPTRFPDKIHKRLLLKYDRLITSTADTLVTNTETHAEYLHEEYGCKNVHVIRNSFDPGDFENIGTEKYPVFTISHIGSIYGKRNPDLLFAAVQQLVTEYAPKKLQLQINFVGLGGQSLRKSVEKYQLTDYVNIIDQVSHHQAIESMCRSHLLLLIKATGKWSRGQIPGKFFEYIGSRNLILCIGPQDSEVANIIWENKLGYVVEDNEEEMFATLKTAYQQYLQKGSLVPLQETLIEPFSSVAMVNKMSSLFGSH